MNPHFYPTLLYPLGTGQTILSHWFIVNTPRILYSTLFHRNNTSTVYLALILTVLHWYEWKIVCAMFLFQRYPSLYAALIDPIYECTQFYTKCYENPSFPFHNIPLDIRGARHLFNSTHAQNLKRNWKTWSHCKEARTVTWDGEAWSVNEAARRSRKDNNITIC